MERKGQERNEGAFFFRRHYITIMYYYYDYMGARHE